MEESTIQMITMALVLLFPVACLISCLVASAYQLKDEEQTEISLWLSIPISIVCNSVVWLLAVGYFFPFQNPVALISRLLRLQCSYQDISRLVGLDFICLLWSALFPIFLIRWYLGKRTPVSMSKRRSTMVLLVLSICLLPLLAGVRAGGEGRGGIKLIEVCRKTTNETVQMISGTLEEDMGSYVIIKNDGILDFEADKLYLSTKEDQFNQISMKDVHIGRGETYVYQMKSAEGLNIRKSGGSVVYLNAADGSVLDKVKVPELEEEQAYRRTADGWEIVQLAEPEEEPVEVDMPEFSAESGFYDGAFDLTISAPKGTKVYYTLDGSDPTAKSSRYDGAIHVYDRSGEEPVLKNVSRTRYDYERSNPSPYTETDRCFVIRAVAVDADGNISPIKTASYFINADQYRTGTVISLVSDPDELFGEDGICVTGREYDEWYQEQLEIAGEDGKFNYSTMPLGNFKKQGEEWEREASFEVFEDGKQKLSKHVGIRVQGNYSRHLNRLKRFSIYARKRYDGTTQFEVPLVNDFLQHALVLREGDNYAVTQRLSLNRTAATIDFIPVTVFLDGEFYYRTFMYEKYNEANFAEKYHVIKDNIAMLKNGDIEDIYDDGALQFSSMGLMFMNGSEGEDLYEEFCEYADVQSYIDGLVINLYMANMDYAEMANNLMWHTVVEEDSEFGNTKWRWGIVDVDLNWSLLDDSYGRIEPYRIDTINMKGNNPTVKEWSAFPHLIVNDEFRKQFIMTFMDLMNYDFEPERALRVMEDLKIENEKLSTFLQNRPKYMASFLMKEYGLSRNLETVTLTSNRSGTPITLNTITPELEEGAWSGEYFTDYPVTATANEPGFSHWEVTAKGKTVTLKDKTIEVPVEKGGTIIHAVYE